MSVRQTQSERCLSGLIVLFLLVIGIITRSNAQLYDDPEPDLLAGLDATVVVATEAAHLEPFVDPVAPEAPGVPSLEEEKEVAPDNVDAAPDKVEAVPDKVEATPEKVEATPEKVDATPEKVDATPEKVEATPEKVDATPEKVEVTPEKVEATPEKVEVAPDSDEATPGEDPKTEVDEVDATAQVQLMSDAPSEAPEKPIATAAQPAQPDVKPKPKPKFKDKKKKKSKKKFDKKKKKKKKKTPKKKFPKTTAEPIPVDPPTPTPDLFVPEPVDPKPEVPKPVELPTTAPEPVVPEPVEPEPEVPELPIPESVVPVDPKPEEPVVSVDPKPEEPVVPEPVDPIPEEPVVPEPVDPKPEEPVVPEPVEPKPEVPKPEEPEPPKPEPVVPEPVDPEPVVPEPVDPKPEVPKPEEPQPPKPEPVVPEPEPEPVDPKPVVPKPVDPKPVEPEPEVEKKPEGPVTQGPCIDVYTNAQKRQACPGGWKDRVRILTLQVDKLKTDNEKLWMQVTEIHGKIRYSRAMISESHLSTNTWKKRVAFPDDDEVKEDLTDCNDALGKGHKKPGVYLLNPADSAYNVRALCVNGWTVVQRRFDGSEDFNRDFDDYMAGFGNFSGEFFIGLDNLHRMAKGKEFTLRVDAKGASGKWYYGVYEDFKLSDEKDDYRLSIGNMSSGNYFDGFENSREQQFSSRDRDNDQWRGGNCAGHFGGGWWSDTCSTNLNQMWCRTGCLRWADKRVISSIIRIKPSEAVVDEDLSENPNPGGLSLDEIPA